MSARWLVPHGVETNGVGHATTAHLNLHGRTMADVWGLTPAEVAMAQEPPPSGSSVYCLVSRDGSYLHESGTCLTADKQYRWRGSPMQLDKVRRSLEVAKDLRAERVA